MKEKETKIEGIRRKEKKEREREKKDTDTEGILRKNKRDKKRK